IILIFIVGLLVKFMASMTKTKQLIVAKKWFALKTHILTGGQWNNDITHVYANSCNLLCTHGTLAIFEWALANGCNWVPYAINILCRRQDTTLLKHAINCGAQWYRNTELPPHTWEPS